MKSHIIIFFVGSCILSSLALPVTQIKEEEKKETNLPEETDLEVSLGYERYMKEVAAVLESDPNFRSKLNNATEEEIRSGKIAENLENVNITVRLKLDEIKRRELQRLNELMEMENEINGDDSHLKHLDHKNQHTFEAKDLKDLINKIYHDLEIHDQKRKEQFKQYEMQKKFDEEMKKNQMAKDQREKFEREQKEIRERHKNHPKIHYPGHKAQLQEVWEQQDHMDVIDFEPKKFFMFHDLDGNGFWDDNEVKALLVKQLDKGYLTDVVERAEELERMREDFYKQYDVNRDHMVSMDEFLKRSREEAFNEDQPWQTVGEIPQFTQEQYLEFERRRREDLQRRYARGEIPPHHMPQGYVHDPNLVYQAGQQHQNPYQQQPMHYQDPQQQHIQQQQQYHQQQQQYQHQQQQQYQQQQYQQQQYQQQQYQQQQYQQPQYQQQQPQYQQHLGQQVNLNANQAYQQIPIQQHQQPQPQVGNQVPPQPQHQPMVNNLPPAQNVATNNMPAQQPVASNNLPPQQPVASNNLPPQQPVASNNLPPQQPVASNNLPPQQPVASNNLPPQQHSASSNLPPQPVASNAGAKQPSSSNNVQP